MIKLTPITQNTVVLPLRSFRFFSCFGNISLNVYNVKTEGILQSTYQVPKEALTPISFYPLTLKYFKL